MESREILLERLTETVSQLLTVCQNLRSPRAAAREDWTAQDILGHITFWHESFARNVSDLAHGLSPAPLKGKLIDLNQQGVAEMRPYSLEAVSQRLAAAQRVIQANILNSNLKLIPYRHGSRAYTPEEHLVMVIRHIQAHLRSIQAVSPTAR